MSDFNYGGTDEESAEIKKLNAEVVSLSSASGMKTRQLTPSPHSSRTQITSRIGRNLFAPPRLSRVA
jgi:hypothetical protein